MKTYWNKTPRKKRLPKAQMREYLLWLADKEPLCQLCGDMADDCHHLFYGNLGADKDDRRLISVCRSCHIFCHEHKKMTQTKYAHIADKNWENFNGTK